MCTHWHPFRAALTFGRVSLFVFVCDAEWWRWNRWDLFYSFPLSLSVSRGWQKPHVSHVHMHGRREEAAPELTNTHTHTCTSSADPWIQDYRSVFWFFHVVRLWATRLPAAGLASRLLSLPPLPRWPPLSELRCLAVMLFTIDKWPCGGTRAACVSHLSPSAHHLHELMKRCTDRCPPVRKRRRSSPAEGVEEGAGNMVWHFSGLLSPNDTSLSLGLASALCGKRLCAGGGGENCKVRGSTRYQNKTEFCDLSQRKRGLWTAWKHGSLLRIRYRIKNT